MSVISDLIDKVNDPDLRARLNEEVARMQKQKKFGLVFEEQEADKAKVEEELADVFLCAIMLADKYGIDIKDICLKKIEKNASVYWY